MRKNCKICKENFQAIRTTKEYCSRKCISKNRYLNNKEKILSKNKEYRDNNPDKIKEIHKKYHQNNKDTQNQKRRCRYVRNIKEEKQRKKDKYHQNPEIYKNRNKKWVKENKDSRNKYLRFYSAKYRAIKLQATLEGFDQEIKEIYKNCPEGYEVDHIMPLQGIEIRGLHVPWNLQYLTVRENRMKSNKILGDL